MLTKCKALDVKARPFALKFYTSNSVERNTFE